MRSFESLFLFVCCCVFFFFSSFFLFYYNVGGDACMYADFDVRVCGDTADDMYDDVHVDVGAAVNVDMYMNADMFVHYVGVVGSDDVVGVGGDMCGYVD